MLILNTGGTFNKRYNCLSGKLEVPFDNKAVESILQSYEVKYNLAGVIYKDSLDIDINDRKMLASIIHESDEDSFLIIHGTDTIAETAEFLSEIFLDKKIVITGAMKPFEVENLESSINLGMSIGFLQALQDSGVYICMSGHIGIWNTIQKNKSKGIFELVL